LTPLNSPASIKSSLGQLFASEKIFRQSTDNGALFDIQNVVTLLDRRFPVDGVREAIRDNDVRVESGSRKHYLILLSENKCGLDCEEVLRTVLRSYLNDRGYLTIGDSQREFNQNPKSIRRLIDLLDLDVEQIGASLGPQDYTRYGIDLIALPQLKRPRDFWIIELKGRMAHEFRLRDFYELLFQLSNRILTTRDSMPDDAFKRIRFAVALPNFETGLIPTRYLDWKRYHPVVG
jgi:hypothetical protein